MHNVAYNDDSKIWTYEDVKKLDQNRRYEVINGVLYVLESPNIKHQRILIEISTQIENYLKGKKCKLFISPTDVNFDRKIKGSINFVQPDIFVICNEKKINKGQVKGAPDLIVEILSPSTHRKDRFEKLNLYLENKVREFWIVDPIKKKIEVYLLEKKAYECVRTISNK